MSESDFSPPATPDLDKNSWRNNVARLIRRSAIDQNFPRWRKTYSTQAIKDRVRERESRLAVKDLVEGLASEEFMVDPRMVEVAQKTFEGLKDKYPEIEAVVIAGSSAQGGAMVRNATGSVPSDFDWGLITNQDTGFKIGRITEDGKKIIVNEGKRLKLGRRFGPCKTFNPTELQATNITDQDKIYDSLEFLGTDNTTRWERDEVLQPLIIYFLPSWPAQINQDNRRQVLEALSRLSIDDHVKWQTAVEAISSKWQEFHVIKEKHFKIAGTHIRDWKLRRNVAAEAPISMSGSMTELLMSTDASKETVS